MKTLEKFKTSYNLILDSRDEYKKAGEKQYKKMQKKAGMLRMAIGWLESGLTENTMRADMERIKKTLSVLDGRFDAEDVKKTREERKMEYRAYRKKWGYAGMEKTLKNVRFVINF